jgi:hypothetical protein
VLLEIYTDAGGNSTLNDLRLKDEYLTSVGYGVVEKFDMDYFFVKGAQSKRKTFGL